MVRLDQFVTDGVVEALRFLLERLWYIRSLRCSGPTGPVTVLLDFVAHVPTKSGGHVPDAADALGAAL